MIVYTVTGTVGQAGYLDIANSGDITGKNIYVNMTNRCPCSCVFCLRQTKKMMEGNTLWLKEGEPSVERVMEIFDAYDLNVINELIFCGYGEPTERLDVLLAVAAHLKGRDPALRVRVNTNGLSDLINGKPTAPLFAGKVDCLSISLNTDDPAEYLSVCRPRFGEAAYPAMLKFTQEAAALLPSVVMTVVGEPVTSLEKQARCRAIAARLGAHLRVRPYESK